MDTHHPRRNGRRAFLKGAAAAGLILGSGFTARAAQAAANPREIRTISFDRCVAMTPQQIAEASPLARKAWTFLRETAGGIQDAALRRQVLDILDNPAPTLAQNLDQKAAAKALREAGLLAADPDTPLLPPVADPQRAPQPFFSAPGSGWQSHHAYPGGLATHVAMNVRSTLGLLRDYPETFGFAPDKDVALAAQLLHDLHKPWVFQWRKDGACRTEQPLAATGEHHVLSVAESIVRKLPAPVVVAQACAHTHPGTAKDEALVVGWIKAAALLAGVDPVRADLLAPGGKTLPLPRRAEGFLVHLGDHDFVLSVPAAQWVTPALRNLAEEKYGLKGADLDGLPFNNFRNYVFAQVSAMRLYGALAAQGPAAVAELAAAAVRPA
ncbi:metal-dependent phosphohydrolase [Desulfovibrio legallii]|uniref:Tat (Twin-arginine translocation) pathway signal sequence n=1 Tax=Desulfovibrio legallii TaxID=571438 RepID=A0A1G7JWQ3_9BACT|nr:metal-dependent phosphohydrolase [Desulfovibrio legallii]SDF29291.1 hypothetical protein SAMN05192586_103168 [Desulfovibrio legallii]